MSLIEILTMTDEAALVITKGKVTFANDGACRLLGQDCVGKKAEVLLGPEASGCPAPGYLVNTEIAGKNCIMRVKRLEEGRLVFLRLAQDTPIVINDAFLYSLRSSLMTLGVAADRLRSGAEELQAPGMREDLTSLTACYYKLMRLSANISFLKNLYENRTEITPTDLNLSLFLHSVLDALESFYPSLCIERDIQQSVYLQADVRLFRLLLFNLLSNCLVHADARTIRIRLVEVEELILLGVTDDGKGIAPHELAGVFERYRADYLLSEIYRGAGFGLAVARGVTRLHGGTLLLESRPGQGTAVRASFKKRGGTPRFGAGEELCSVQDVLLGLADCLPLQCFDQKFLD